MNLRYSHIILDRVPEANIQAEFYRICRKYGIAILLEIKYEDCRFDAIIFRNDTPFAIVEVKNRSERSAEKGLNKRGRQMKKYTRFGLPIIAVLSSKHILPSVEKVLMLLQKADEQDSFLQTNNVL